MYLLLDFSELIRTGFSIIFLKICWGSACADQSTQKIGTYNLNDLQARTRTMSQGRNERQTSSNNGNAPSGAQLRMALSGMPTVEVEMATAMAETGEEAEKVQKAAEAENLPPNPVPAAQSAVAPTTKAENLTLQPQHLHPLGLLHPPRRPSSHHGLKYAHASLLGLQTKIIPMTRFGGIGTQKNSSPTTVHQMSTLPHRPQKTMAIPDPPHSAENPIPGPKTARHRNPYGTSAEERTTSPPPPPPPLTIPLSSGPRIDLSKSSSTRA